MESIAHVEPGSTDFDARIGRDYHVFIHKDIRILYDLSSRHILEITDERIYDLLLALKDSDLDTAVAALDARHGGACRPWAEELLQGLMAGGLLRRQRTEDQKAEDGKVEDGKAEDGKAEDGKVEDKKVEDKKVDAIRERYIEGLWRHHPRRIQLFVAQACNMACVYCYASHNGSNDRNALMTFERARQAVDYMIRMSRNRKELTIQFFGGEPLLNFSVVRQIVEYTQEISRKSDKVFGYQISTNGTLLTEEIQDFITQYGMGILLSLDGDEETHNAQRPLRDSEAPTFQLIVDNALSLNEKYRGKFGRSIKIRANLTRGIQRPSEVVKGLNALGFDRVGVSGIYDRPGEFTEFAFTDEERDVCRASMTEALELWLEAVENGRETDDAYTTEIVANSMKNLCERRPLGSIICGVGRNTNAVDVDGNIYPCHRYVGLTPFIIGNIETGLDRDLTRQYYGRLYDLAMTHCAQCFARGLCGVMCPWSVSRSDGDMVAPDGDTCDATREGMERAMYIYVRLAKKRPDLLRRFTNHGTTIYYDPADAESEGSEQKA